MLRTLVIASLVISALIVAAYRHDETTSRADFAYVNPSGINTLDPAAMTWTNDLRIAINIWEGLTTYEPVTATPISGAAETPRISPDGRIHTFAIRENARWSNGDRVTAGDFLRGWRRAIEPGTAGDYAFFITNHVAGAREYCSC